MPKFKVSSISKTLQELYSTLLVFRGGFKHVFTVILAMVYRVHSLSIDFN